MTLSDLMVSNPTPRVGGMVTNNVWIPSIENSGIQDANQNDLTHTVYYNPATGESSLSLPPGGIEMRTIPGNIRNDFTGGKYAPVFQDPTTGKFWSQTYGDGRPGPFKELPESMQSPQALQQQLQGAATAQAQHRGSQGIFGGGDFGRLGAIAAGSAFLPATAGILGTSAAATAPGAFDTAGFQGLGIGSLMGVSDPIEGIIGLGSVPGATTATEGAAILGYPSVDAALHAINPAWGTAAAAGAGAAIGSSVSGPAETISAPAQVTETGPVTNSTLPTSDLGENLITPGLPGSASDMGLQSAADASQVTSPTKMDKILSQASKALGIDAAKKLFSGADMSLSDWLQLGVPIAAIGAIASNVNQPSGIASVSHPPLAPLRFKQTANPNFGQPGQAYFNQQYVPAAQGGLMSSGIRSLNGYAYGGRLTKGPGDGLSDSIPATIDGQTPARLADSEFVIPADAVAALGGGSTDAGAKRLYEMLDRIRQQAYGHKRQMRKVGIGALPI